MAFLAQRARSTGTQWMTSWLGNSTKLNVSPAIRSVSFLTQKITDLSPVESIFNPRENTSWSPQIILQTQQKRWRSRAGTPSWKKKRLRKEAAQEVREAVHYAEQFDPMRVARRTILQTCRKLGWPVHRDAVITEGVRTFLAFQHMYVCLEVVPPDAYYEGTHVLRPEYQSHHDLIRRKGWKVIVINQRAWEKSLQKLHGQHLARANLLIHLVSMQAPFEPRRNVSLPSENDFGVYDVMRRQAKKHGKPEFSKLRGKGRVRMRSRRSLRR